MPHYKNILVGIDGSDEAKHAFQKAVDLAVDDQAHLIIAHVIDTRTYATIAQYDRTIVERAGKHANVLLDTYKEEAEKAGIKQVTTLVEHGSPKHVIPKELAVKFDADVIVVGATGLNAVERLLIGSVSSAIARYAPCDVVLVRNQQSY
ncbi:universal stress protein [Alteribacillus iranensis]|uniref:Universal stress protein n=1 Tax=Alteribacillus iranensis TaxID=930128 RepID=A0A1I2D4T7_9BACI|nr:universal stress protein [Alteribacillus iranensis]SFE75073.1 Nucleotide-binding universal stress protein, UspA family [Alteribacillus iranensis]